MTISEIKDRSHKHAPYFFSKDTLSWFGQTMSSFRVKKMDERFYKISAPMIDKSNGNKYMGETIRYFDNVTDELHSQSDYDELLKVIIWN